MTSFTKLVIKAPILLLGTVLILSGCTPKPYGPTTPVKEDCIGFSPVNAAVKSVNDDWKIVDGSHWMFSFGDKKDEALRALKIIKYYSMNQSCFVGRPDPSFTYMLVKDHSPIGAMNGEDCVSFNPQNIEVVKIGGRWKIVDESHWIFDFDSNHTEAVESFNIIKKYGFTKSCYVGRPDPSFSYLRK